jgi:membrane-associated phospholipid phosphatase
LLRRGQAALIVALQLIYLPLNATLQHGTLVKTAWDAYVPIWPVWVVPYNLFQPLWIATLLWAAWRMEARLYRAYVIAHIAVISASMACYVLYPTYIERPLLTGSDVFSEALRWVYQHDRVYNACPSGHIYLTLLGGGFYARWYPRWRFGWALIVIVIILSTLFTGQHHLVDLAGGALVAGAGYLFGLWRAGFLARESAPPLHLFRRPR